MNAVGPLLVALALAFAGCMDPKENQPPKVGSGSPSASMTSSPSTSSTTTDAATPPASVLSLLSCSRSAALFRAPASGATMVPPDYTPQGGSVVSVVLLLLGCDRGVIGNESVIQDVRLAMTYVLIEQNDTEEDTAAYVAEIFGSDSTVVGFLTSAGFPATLGDLEIAVGLQGGTFRVSSGDVAYEGTVAGVLDEEGQIPDQAFVFKHMIGGEESLLVHALTFDGSSQTVAPVLVQIQGGAMGALWPLNTITGAIDLSMVDATLVDA